MFGLEIGVADSLGPFSGGSLAYLHEAVLAGGTASVGVEAAFAPDDGFDEGGVELVGVGGVLDLGIEGALTLVGTPPEVSTGVEHGEREEYPQPAAVHGDVVGHGRQGVERGLLIVCPRLPARAGGRCQRGRASDARDCPAQGV